MICWGKKKGKDVKDQKTESARMDPFYYHPHALTHLHTHGMMRPWEPIASYPFRLIGKSMRSPVSHRRIFHHHYASFILHRLYSQVHRRCQPLLLVAQPLPAAAAVVSLHPFIYYSLFSLLSLLPSLPPNHESRKNEARALCLWIRRKCNVCASMVVKDQN